MQRHDGPIYKQPDLPLEGQTGSKMVAQLDKTWISAGGLRAVSHSRIFMVWNLHNLLECTCAKACTHAKGLQSTRILVLTRTQRSSYKQGSNLGHPKHFSHLREDTSNRRKERWSILFCRLGLDVTATISRIFLGQKGCPVLASSAYWNVLRASV
jgi:hypothetical protein